LCLPRGRRAEPRGVVLSLNAAQRLIAAFGFQGQPIHGEA